MLQIKTFIPFIVIITCLFAVTGCDTQSKIAPSGQTVRIGLIAPFSGTDDEWGPNALLGSKVALEIQPYLKNGDKAEIITADNGHDPSLTQAALKKLVQVDKVSAVLILSNSEVTLAAIRDADRYKTPILALIATHPEVGNDQWVIQFVFDDVLQGNVAALYVRDEMFVEHAAVINNPEDPHSAFLAREFTDKFKETGGTIEFHSLKPGITDYTDLIGRLHATGLNFIYLPLSAEKVVAIEKAARTLNWNPQIMVSDGVLSAIQLQYDEELYFLEGMLATDLYTTITPLSEYGQKARRIYRDSPDAKTATFAALGCEATSIVLAAIDRCKESSDKECLNRMLRQSKEFTGLFDKIKIGENGKTERPIYINTIENHLLKFLVKVY